MDLFLGGIMFESSSVFVSEVNEKEREGNVVKIDEGRDREAVGLIECFPSQEVLERRKEDSIMFGLPAKLQVVWCLS